MCGMNRRPLHIIVDFNVRHKAARDMIAGIMRYATAHPRWELMLRGNHPSNDGFVTDGSAQIDGLISGYGNDINRTNAPNQTDIRRLLRRGSPLKGIAVISVPPVSVPGIPCSRIDVDHREIARQSGFASETYLKNLFKKKYGMTMSEYRERN